MERTRDLVLAIWLRQKDSTCWQVPLLKCVVSRGRNDMNGWPAVPYRVCQLQSIHRPGHTNICKNRSNVPAAFKDQNCLISLLASITSKPASLITSAA